MTTENDLIGLLKAFWAKKKIVIRFVVVFAILGLFMALFTPKEFNSGTTFMPQEMDSGGGLAGQFGGLAAIAGINLGSVNAETLAPEVYPRIMYSTPFLQSLLDTRLQVEGHSDSMSLRQYYEEIYDAGLPAVVMEYTIGLPGLVLSAIRGEQVSLADQEFNDGMIRMDQEEYFLLKLLKEKLQIEVNKVEGHVTLISKMPTAHLSAQVTMHLKNLLQEKIISLKLEKVNDQLQFVEERYEEKKVQFRAAQKELAVFKDGNIRNTTATSLIRESELQAEYDLAFSVVSELEKQLETYRLKAKETMPIFTTINPVEVPVLKSKPRRLKMLVISGFLGVFLGLAYVGFILFIARFKAVWNTNS